MSFDPSQPIWIHPSAIQIQPDASGNYQFDLRVTMNQLPNRSDGTLLQTLSLPHSADIFLRQGNTLTQIAQVTVTAQDFPGLPQNATKVIPITLNNVPSGD